MSIENKEIKKHKGDTKPTWTPEQLEAITARDCNLLVAAAAGAGKTAVLVERIIKKITDETNPIDIDKLLIVTFTNAAATEMRERIGDAIAKALDQNPESKQLQRQLTLLHKASITTIHSFCLEVIKNHFHYIDLDPNFRIADETESLLMKMEALEELFEERYEEENITEDFIRLVECYGGNRDDQMLQDMVFALHDFVQSCPWPQQWLYEKVEDFNISEEEDFSHTAWAKVLMQSIEIQLTGLQNAVQKAVSIIHTDEALLPYLESIQGDEVHIKQLLENCDGRWDNFCYILEGIEFKKFARCGKGVNKAKQEAVKKIRESIKKVIKELKEQIFVSFSREISEDLKRLYPLMKCLAQLVLDFDARYVEKKKEKLLIDFNDLEHFCLNILTQTDSEGNMMPSEAAQGYKQRFEEIFVDEYQDSNLVQEVILGMISRKDDEIPNLFMVGDVKQSIYRFRQARPDLFLQKYNTYEQCQDSKNRKIQLYKNFRSRQEVIDSVNFLFTQMMSTHIGELDYTDEEALNLGAQYEPLQSQEDIAGGSVELHLVDMTSSKDDAGTDEESNEEESLETDEANEEQKEDLDAVQCEARIVAKRIKELMGPNLQGQSFKIYDKKKKMYRCVDYRDIVILLRATRNWAGSFMEELNAQGIPVYADTGTGYFKTVEVQLVMSLLQVIDNPRQDIPLLAVLRSPILGFTPDELIDIRLADREGSFYEALQKFVIQEGSNTVDKVKSFLTHLEMWRNKALYMSTDELLWYLYMDTGYYSYVGAMPGGSQRQANLRVLFERARQYEETSYKGLFNFINFINRLKSNQGDMGSAKILGENDNVVRIMSIHKSKGLEFPVTIVAGMGKKFNLMDMNKSILLHQELGFGPDLVDCDKRFRYPTVAKHALKTQIKLESLSEEMRVLYVALTRAKEKLIMIGSVKGLEKNAARWCGSLNESNIKLPPYDILKGTCYLDWIGPAVIRHEQNAELRKAAGIHGDDNPMLLQDNSCWEICVWRKNDILVQKEEADQDVQALAAQLQEIAKQEDTGQYYEEICRKLEWEYPYKMSAVLPAKMTVTELKRRFNIELSEEYASAIFVPSLVKKPLFMAESKTFTAAERGTILHAVMQHLDLGCVLNITDIERQVEGMVVNELLTQQQIEAVDLNKIYQFFKSSLGQRLLKSDSIYREVPFNIELKCTEVYSGLENEIYDQETVLLQGVIDCYFEEQGDIVLVDYKTDYVPVGGQDSIKEKYRIQIDYYTKALEKITGKKVKEKYIYLFWNGEILSYN